MADLQDNIKLLVKSLDQRIDDQVIECQLDWSVEKLKYHLKEFYPGNPKVCEQKIILSGQVLTDLIILKDVLQEHHIYKENTYIIHFVCTSLSRFSTPLAKSSMTKTTEANTNEATTTTITTNSAVNTSSNSTFTQPSFMQNQQFPGVQLNNQQMLWMQQAYANYLTQYMQVINAQGTQWQSTIPYAQTSSNINNNNNNNNNLNNVGSNVINNNTDNNNENNERNQINPPVQAQAVVPNNQQNNNNNEDIDWLDLFDMFVRFFIFTSIIYYYSSPSRFFVVTFIVFVIYLIQTGFFRLPTFIFGDNNNGAMENNNNNNNQQQQQQENNGQERQNVQLQQQNNEQVQNVEQTIAVRDNERPNALTFAWTFFSSFFTSLIPEQPPVI